MKKFTDFHWAAISALPCILGDFIASGTDIAWAFEDFAHAPEHIYLLKIAAALGTTLPLFTLSVGILIYSIIVHNRTGKKPVQSSEDIDYRISLAFAKHKFSKLCAKEKAIRKLVK